jgi:hypothetical protein
MPAWLDRIIPELNVEGPTHDTTPTPPDPDEPTHEPGDPPVHRPAVPVPG